MDEKVSVLKLYHGKEEISCVVKNGRRRRTLSVQVSPQGQVSVYVPWFVSRKEAKKFVEKRADWIVKSLSHFRELEKKFPKKEFVSGESFPLFGRNYRLEVLRGATLNGSVCKINGKRLQVALNGHNNGSSKESVKQALRNFYAAQTQRKVSDVIRRYVPAIDVRPESVKIVNQLRRWGSCSPKGSIRINWRLSMMPVSVLTYIVVHELCHLKVRNHSDRFWWMLQSVLPDYAARRAWLNDNSALVTFLD